MAKRKSGQGLVEYCLLLLLVTMVVIIALRSLGETVRACHAEPVQSAVSHAANP